MRPIIELASEISVTDLTYVSKYFITPRHFFTPDFPDISNYCYYNVSFISPPTRSTKVSSASLGGFILTARCSPGWGQMTVIRDDAGDINVPQQS